MSLYNKILYYRSLKIIPNSGASRSKKNLKFTFLLNKRLKHLTTKYVWASGINNKGKISVRSKGKKIIKGSSLILNHQTLDNSLHFLYNINYSKDKKFPFALLFSSSGKYSYTKLFSYHSLFDILSNKSCFNMFYQKNSLLKSNINFHYFKTLHVIIFRLPSMAIIQNLQISPGKISKFSRSLGSYSIILRKNLHMLSAVIKLPSGVRKIFSFFASCNAADKDSILFKTTSPKKNYFKGIAPRSRGVAKNPVDHPHGGRTKSIKYPRTPWGKTTKFK